MPKICPSSSFIIFFFLVTEYITITCFLFRLNFHHHGRHERCLLGRFHRYRAAILFAGTRHRITLLLYHVRQVTVPAIAAFFHAPGHGVDVFDDCEVVFMDSVWQVLVICDVAMFAFEVLRPWWDGRGFTGF